MDLNFYSDLSDGCAQNVDSGFLDTQSYGAYQENKFPGGGDSYLSITGGGHPFLSAEQTFHTPSLGDEVFEIPPISLDTDSALNVVGDVVSHFSELSAGGGGPSGSGSLVSNLVVGANDPSFASNFVNPGPQGLEHLNLAVLSQAGGGALLSSTALELGTSNGSHFSSSSPMTIDVQLGDIGHGLLGGQLSTINQSELGLSLGGGNILARPSSPDQPLSATASPAGSLQDEDMDDFRKSVLVDSPMALSSVLAHILPHTTATSASPSPVVSRRGGGKPATLTQAPAGAKKGKKKKDPNEPQKPVSAYALFFRDTQAAIKGQNPNASFGEVSKIVASMWDSLAEEQKQVYKRKTEAAKKEYLKALAAYRANQLSQPAGEVKEAAAPPPAPPPPTTALPPPTTAAPGPAPVALQLARLAQGGPEENTITNICASNIILDVPEVTTRSRTGANKPAAEPTVTKIIISKQMLQAGGQLVTVLPAGLASRQPPPLQQMQSAPPPPRLQQMAPAPPPLQAKPREGGPSPPSAAAAAAATPPPPLQIKIVPASLGQGTKPLPVIVAAGGAGGAVAVSLAASLAPSLAPPLASSLAPPGVGVRLLAEPPGSSEEDVVSEVSPSEEVHMELNDCSDATSSMSVCVRAGCNNPAVESQDWDKEYCSNECVATHCRDIFMAWCSIRNQNMGTVK